MKSITLLFLISLSFSVFSQKIDLDNFTYLKSEGSIPEDFLNTSYSKYKSEVSNSEFEKKLFIKNTKKQFILRSTYLIDDLLHSGSVFYNDPISDYINRVADVLLKSEPELRDEIRFYVTKSTAVNAFATDKGMIFINIGLVAQLSNEAELAYILAHEIVHYAEKHNMEMYVKKETIKRGKSDYKILSSDEKFLATNYWSKEIESKADEDALVKYYSKTDYSLKAIIGVFDVLQYSYLPFDEIPFDFSMLESPYYKIPVEYIIKEINPILAEDDYDDTKSTHPNTMKRRTAVINWINNLPPNKDLKYIVSEKEFNEIKDLARFETIRQQIINGDYGNAMYNCNIVLKKYPNNFFLQKSIATCLYSCVKYKNNDDISDVITYPDKIEGQSHQVFYFFREIKEKELNVIALHYVWKLYNKHPEDFYLGEIFDDLFNDLCAINKYKTIDFSYKPKDESINDLKREKDEIDTTKLTKYDRIKLQKKEKEIDEAEWLRFAFVDALADTAFSNRFNYYSSNAKRRIADLNPKDDEDEDNDVEFSSEELLAKKKEDKEKEKLERKERLFGKALGINRIIVIDPVYQVIDYRDNENKYIAGESRLLELQNALQKCAQISNLDLVLLDSKTLTTEDNTKMNDIALFQDWFSEKLMNSEQTIYGSTSAEIIEAAAQYDADYIAWIAVVNEHYSKDYVDLAYLTVCTVLVPIIFPYVIYYVLKPEITTYYYFLLFDVKTGTSKLLQKEVINTTDSKPLIENLVYKSFVQISKTR